MSGRWGYHCSSQQRLDKVAWELKACARVRVRVEERGCCGRGNWWGGAESRGKGAAVGERTGGGSRAMAKVAGRL